MDPPSSASTSHSLLSGAPPPPVAFHHPRRPARCTPDSLKRYAPHPASLHSLFNSKAGTKWQGLRPPRCTKASLSPAGLRLEASSWHHLGPTSPIVLGACGLHGVDAGLPLAVAAALYTIALHVSALRPTKAHKRPCALAAPEFRPSSASRAPRRVSAPRCPWHFPPHEAWIYRSPLPGRPSRSCAGYPSSPRSPWRPGPRPTRSPLRLPLKGPGRRLQGGLGLIEVKAHAQHPETPRHHLSEAQGLFHGRIQVGRRALPRETHGARHPAGATVGVRPITSGVGADHPVGVDGAWRSGASHTALAA